MFLKFKCFFFQFGQFGSLAVEIQSILQNILHVGKQNRRDFFFQEMTDRT